MIIGLQDIIDEVAADFPDIERSSIEKICKTGLSGVNRLLRSGEELQIKLPKRKEAKFFIPCTPEVQAEITKDNVFRRKRRENETHD